MEEYKSMFGPFDCDAYFVLTHNRGDKLKGKLELTRNAPTGGIFKSLPAGRMGLVTLRNSDISPFDVIIELKEITKPVVLGFPPKPVPPICFGNCPPGQISCPPGTTPNCDNPNQLECG